MCYFLTFGQTEKGEYYNRGELVQYFITDEFILSSTIEEVNRRGKQFLVNISILNISDNRFDLIPDSIAAIIIKEDNENIAEVYTASEFKDKIKKGQLVESIVTGLSVGAAMAMQVAYPSPDATTVSTVSGKYGQPIGKVETKIYDGSNASNTANDISNLGRKLSNYHWDEVEQINEGYLMRHTLFPDKETSGFMYIKHQKGDTLEIIIPIKGKEYIFSWDIKKPQKQKKEFEKTKNWKDDMF